MCKVSIIVPVYNVEKYLAICIESIIKQTIKEKEILLMNVIQKIIRKNILFTHPFRLEQVEYQDIYLC